MTDTVQPTENQTVETEEKKSMGKGSLHYLILARRQSQESHYVHSRKSSAIKLFLLRIQDML